VTVSLIAMAAAEVLPVEVGHEEATLNPLWGEKVEDPLVEVAGVEWPMYGWIEGCQLWPADVPQRDGPSWVSTYPRWKNTMW
jgi:hypothetical protein